MLCIPVHFGYICFLYMSLFPSFYMLKMPPSNLWLSLLPTKEYLYVSFHSFLSHVFATVLMPHWWWSCRSIQPAAHAMEPLMVPSLQIKFLHQLICCLHVALINSAIALSSQTPSSSGVVQCTHSNILSFSCFFLVGNFSIALFCPQNTHTHACIGVGPCILRIHFPMVPRPWFFPLCASALLSGRFDRLWGYFNWFSFHVTVHPLMSLNKK